MENNEKIIVGMSGGVDSSVAALLLIEQGYQVEGLFMKNWEEDDDEDYCAAEEDLKDAESVCNTLGIKLHRVNFSDKYWNNVFQHFLKEYKAGRTPNPDVLCNREIKFGAFLDKAKDLGANKIATGHYAQIEKKNGLLKLIRGVDTEKDQSYFLYTLSQKQLSHALFPLGSFNKQEIRLKAKNARLLTHDKKDSTGICFIGERRFDTFLQKYLPVNTGNIVTMDGKVIGEHKGLMYYTFGQRKGLGVGGVENAKESPWYVVEKDAQSNNLIVAQGDNHPRLYHDTLECSQLNWISENPPPITSVTAKIRYRQADQLCEIQNINDSQIKVVFAEAQRAISPGQSIVFYDDEVCIGGGIIETMYNSSKLKQAV